MPEDAEFPFVDLSVLERLVCLVDTEELVVAREDLRRGLMAVVEQDEVLEQIHEVLLGEQTPLSIVSRATDPTSAPPLESLPLVEELIATSQGPDS